MKNLLKPLPFAFLLAACTSFVPQYEKPKVDVPQNWEEFTAEDLSQGEEPQELSWREFYRDPRLQTLIETALANNYDLKQAALNIQMAQAQYDIQKADDLPTVGFNGSITRTRNPRDLSGGRSSVRDAYSIGAGVAAFELDFFGRVEAMNENALLKYLATYEARDAAQLALISAVAKTYQQARIAKAQMELADDVVRSRRESYRLTNLLTQAGVVTAQDLSGVESQIEAARANFSEAKRSYQLALNGLSRLIGKPLSEVDLPPANSLKQQFTELRLPKGIASEVLQKRPDIREAEYQLKAANANIGAARAMMYPSISLTGKLGFGSLELGQLLKQPNSTWSFGPTINLPIFDGHRRENNVKIAETRQKQLIENYKKVVQSAFYDVADALAAKETLTEQYAAQKRAYDAVSNRLRLVNLRFKHGVSNALDLLDAQRESYAVAQGLLATQLKMLNNHIDLFTAMGGGLEEYDVKMPDLDKKKSKKRKK